MMVIVDCVVKDYQKKYTIGNILTDSIKDILTSKESKRLISQIYGSNSKDKVSFM